MPASALYVKVKDIKSSAIHNKNYVLLPVQSDSIVWMNFRGLVRDGVSYSYELVMDRMGYESI